MRIPGHSWGSLASRIVVLLVVLLVTLIGATSALDAAPPSELPDAPRADLSKKFLIAHSILAASVLFDGEVTHSHYVFSRGCYESSDWYGDQVTSWHIANGRVLKAYNFSRTRFYAINGGIFAGVTAVDFLLQHHFHHVPVLRDLPYALPAVFSLSHWHGGATWLARGC